MHLVDTIDGKNNPSFLFSFITICKRKRENSNNFAANTCVLFVFPPEA